jgi:hypothetical protein
MLLQNRDQRFPIPTLSPKLLVHNTPDTPLNAFVDGRVKSQTPLMYNSMPRVINLIFYLGEEVFAALEL